MIERISNPSVTKAIVNKYEFAFQKRFGQNFLIDGHVINKIVDGSELSSDDIAVEIGPGIGSLTQYLCEVCDQVIAIEIDKVLIPILEDTLRDYDNLTIINEDVLKVDMDQLLGPYKGKDIKIVANLPYYITTPIIMNILENRVPVKSITIMIQKEVADRINASPGNKNYGALSLAVQYYAKTQLVANVPPNCFMPRPKVGSAVIRLIRHESPIIQVKDDHKMFKIIRSAFNQRRKTMSNTLKHHLNIDKTVTSEVLESLGINPSIRGEALSLEQYALITDKMIELGAI